MKENLFVCAIVPPWTHHIASTFERNHYDVGMYRGGSEAYKRCGWVIRY